MNELYPIFMKLTGRTALVVGGGKVGLRKVLSLLKTGARVIAVSKEFDAGFASITDANLVMQTRAFVPSDIHGASIVIAATSDESVNKEIFALADEAKIPVNVVDKPDICTFYVPSSFSRGDLQIAISTSGKAPALAKKIREDLELQYGEGYSELLDSLEVLRAKLKKEYPDDEGKRSELMREWLGKKCI